MRLAVSSATAGFLCGALVVSVGVMLRERRQASSAGADATRPPAVVDALTGLGPTPVPSATLPTPTPEAAPAFKGDSLADLRERHLVMPVLGIRPETLRSMFDDARGSSRAHEAIDILAPKGTPVVAVEDGTIAKLFLSDAGGITIYQFDPTTRYAYYYAHLDGYAPGLSDGAVIQRGQTLGYVGVTGNAPKDTPHLHFAIFELTKEKKWWQGQPIDPFLVLK